MLGHVQYLNDAGYSTVLPDLRSFGDSEGNKSFLGSKEWQDIAAVFDSVKSQRENSNKKIGLLGISVGAVSALLTTGETGKGDFIIASVPFKNYQSLFTSQLKREGLSPYLFLSFLKAAAYIEFGSNYESFSPEKEITKIKKPLLLFSAKHDEEVDSNDARILYDLANEPKEFNEFNSHHDIFAELPQEFKEKVLDFLQTVVNYIAINDI